MSNFDTTTPFDALCEKWDPLLEHDSVASIDDPYRKKVTAALLENQERAITEQNLNEAAPTNSMGAAGFGYTDGVSPSSRQGAIQGYDPILISLVRRAMPNLMAYDLAGVQPMSAPTGLIFAMRSRYGTSRGQANSSTNEALFQEPFPVFSGGGSGPVTQGTTFGNPYGKTGGIDAIFGGTAEDGGPTAAFSASNGVSPILDNGARGADFSKQNFDMFRGMLTGQGEQLGTSGSNAFAEMNFTIERIAVEARTRALKAEYTTELAQDLRAVHGLDAETELANILSTEILSEINRELVRTLYYKAKIGCQQSDISTAGGGVYDLTADSDGRWSAERFRGLMFQIERECNVIAKETRRGKGNFIVVSSDVASALAMGGFLNLSPAINNQLEVDDTGNTFAGILNGRIRVYIDPYAALDGGTSHNGGTYTNHVLVGYKGTSPYDAGVFYCPYVPLQMVRAVDTGSFQPKIGFKTRYGMVSNPFAETVDISQPGGNQYYRLFAVKELHGNQTLAGQPT